MNSVFMFSSSADSLSFLKPQWSNGKTWEVCAWESDATREVNNVTGERQVKDFEMRNRQRILCYQVVGRETIGNRDNWKIIRRDAVPSSANEIFTFWIDVENYRMSKYSHKVINEEGAVTIDYKNINVYHKRLPMQSPAIWFNFSEPIVENLEKGNFLNQRAEFDGKSNSWRISIGRTVCDQNINKILYDRVFWWKPEDPWWYKMECVNTGNDSVYGIYELVTPGWKYQQDYLDYKKEHPDSR